MTNSPDHIERLARARLALEGLSVGDALGETCFHPDRFRDLIEAGLATAEVPWPWTDDTAMALALFEVLAADGAIDPDMLAKRITERFVAEPWRGYGPGAFRMLGAVAGGADWSEASRSMFGGQGSFGNGSAMRIAPLAGYFADHDFETVAEQAAISAIVTHAHPEGVAGAIATAVAGAYAWKNRESRSDAAVRLGLLETALRHTPASDVRDGIERAIAIGLDSSPEAAAAALGNGSRVSCQDTVPFCLYIAARQLDDYRTGILQAIRVGGDIDTSAAIAGGIIVLAAGLDAVPAPWRERREPLGLVTA